MDKALRFGRRDCGFKSCQGRLTMNYLIKQKSFSFLQNFSILDENKNIIFTVKHDFFSFAKSLKILNKENEELIYLEKNKFFNKYEIFVKGVSRGLLKKKFIFSKNFILLLNQEKYLIKGNLTNYDFVFYKDNFNIAQINKKNLPWGKVYSIEIDKNEEQASLLASIIVISLIHRKK